MRRMLVKAILLAVALSGVVFGAAVPTDAQASRRCGVFKERFGRGYAWGGTYRVTVFKLRGRVSCRNAIRIVKDFRFGRGRVSHCMNRHPGPCYGYEDYYTLRRWPGWYLSDGAGGGGAWRGSLRKMRTEIAWEVH